MEQIVYFLTEQAKRQKLVEFLETGPDPPIIIFVNQKKVRAGHDTVEHTHTYVDMVASFMHMNGSLYFHISVICLHSCMCILPI